MIEETKGRALVRAVDEPLPTQEGPPHRRPAKAPTADELPVKRSRRAQGGAEVVEISLELETVTPILGGSYRTRHIDDVERVRVPTIRGHLRFWWRALRGHTYESAARLYEDEGKLWGQTAGGEGKRSVVEVRVDMQRWGQVDDADIEIVGSKKRNVVATPGAYALWPAKSQKAEPKKGRPAVAPAPRVRPGVRFRLTLIAPKEHEKELRHTISAWLLFGGYGSRPRRGLGGLRVVAEAARWLPVRATREAFVSLFGGDIFAGPRQAAGDTPWLAGAKLRVGQPGPKAEAAWLKALDWLKEFRQGVGGKSGEGARESGEGKEQPKRPSISNWPEADKVRRLKGKTKDHPPRHNATPVWPRASFGLPIVGQFQKEGRDGRPLDEPDGFELHWRRGGESHDRLASPLILKAMPLADGTFVPCALWLNRAYPEGEVVMKETANSGAPFDALVARGDQAIFSALRGKQSMRDAFFDWLNRYQPTEVAP